jgi:phospholipase C
LKAVFSSPLGAVFELSERLRQFLHPKLLNALGSRGELRHATLGFRPLRHGRSATAPLVITRSGGFALAGFAEENRSTGDVPPKDAQIMKKAPGAALLFFSLAALLTGCLGSLPPSFTLSPSPNTVGVVQGSAETSTITVNPANRFSGSVSLAASGLPNGVTASFAPNPATANSVLTLAASGAALAGTAAVTITGTSGTLTYSTTLKLITTAPIAKGKINHVVVIIQENRTPDNLFHDPKLISAGADIALQGLTSTGQRITLTPGRLATRYDLDHTHQGFLNVCNYDPATNSCLMNTADLNNCIPSPDECPPYPQYQYVDNSTGDIQPYFTMAETYTFGDRMFQTNQGGSFVAHQYLLSGTSRISTTSSVAQAENPDYSRTGVGIGAGCLANPGSTMRTLDLLDSSPETSEGMIYFPLCFDHPTLTDVLDAAGLSWKYYAATEGYIWTAPDAIKHMCQPSGRENDMTCSGPDWTGSDPKVVIEGSGAQIITDIANQQLASVSWVTPSGAASDHPGTDIDTGPSWVSAIVNAVGQSPYWADTAIIVTWDDFGGWFDHVPPPVRNSLEVGLRVPLIVISPYAKAAYISHVHHDFGSVLRFIEANFGIGEIEKGVGYADAQSDDLADCFNFNQAPLTFRPIPAPLDANYFLNDKSPPMPPDND